MLFALHGVVRTTPCRANSIAVSDCILSRKNSEPESAGCLRHLHHGLPILNTDHLPCILYHCKGAADTTHQQTRATSKQPPASLEASFHHICDVSSNAVCAQMFSGILLGHECKQQRTVMGVSYVSDLTKAQLRTYWPAQLSTFWPT